MKRLLLFLFLLTVTILPQGVTVENITRVTDYNQGAFYYPQFSPDNKTLLLTSEVYMGLWIYDLDYNSITQVNNHLGSGYSPKFSPDGSKLVYRVDAFIDKLKFSDLRAYKFSDRTETILFPQSRFLSEPLKVENSSVSFLKENEIMLFGNELKGISPRTTNVPLVFVENSDLMLQKDGVKKILNPLGNGNYIWASLSSDNSKILFHFAGKGTFITDIAGNVLHELGKANAPQFSPDGKYVTYMYDVDNGDRVLDSKIFVYSLASGEKSELAGGTDLIAMYPTWSSDGKKIAFNTIDGLIYIIELKID